MQLTWHRNDIAAALRSIDGANRSVSDNIHTPEMMLYRMGFEAAIEAVAVVFGIAWRSASRDVIAQEDGR